MSSVNFIKSRWIEVLSINEVQYSVAAQRKGPSKQSQPVEAISVEDQSQYKYFLKLANLPFRFSKEKLVGFTEGKSKPEDCYLDYGRYGRPSGYAYLGLNDKSASTDRVNDSETA